MAARAGRTLFIIDIAVPRDIDSLVGELPNVELRNLDDLRDWARKGVELREGEAAKVRAIVLEEVDKYTVDSTARQAAPLIAALHEVSEEIRQAEMDRFSKKLSGLTPEQRDAVEALTKGITAKLLHQPVVRLKDGTGTPQGERLADAMRDLFDLH